MSLRPNIVTDHTHDGECLVASPTGAVVCTVRMVPVFGTVSGLPPAALRRLADLAEMTPSARANLFAERLAQATAGRKV